MARNDLRYDPNGNLEGKLREDIRDVLGLSWDARDFQIIEEIKRLKAIEDNERAADLHRGINQRVSEALGQPFGASWHDLGEKVAQLKADRDKLRELLFESNDL